MVSLIKTHNLGEYPKMGRMNGLLALLLTVLTVGGCVVQPDTSQVGENQSPDVAVAGGWRLELKVSVPEASADTGLAYNRLVAGEEDTATEGYDHPWDVRALLAGPVKAYFSHAGEAGYGLDSQTLWQDIRKNTLPAQWVVEVNAESGRAVTVRWTLPQGEVNCDTHGFTLEDFDGTLGQTNLCAEESLTYLGDGVVRRLVLKVS